MMILKNLGLDNYFNTIVNCEDIEKSKPHPEGYLLTAKRLGVDIKNCVVLEDAKAGIEAGNAAGAFTIGVHIGNRGRQDLSNADYEVRDLTCIDFEYLKAKHI